MGRKKQTEIPGTERPAIDDIEASMDALLEARGQRTAALEREKAEQATLIAVMQEHSGSLEENGDGDLVYSCALGTVTLSLRNTVRVRPPREPAAGDGE